MFIKSKIQFSESKSQRLSTRYSSNFCCLSSQRYNFLKANHNAYLPYPLYLLVVYQVKDTIFWKQITTMWGQRNCNNMLFIKSKIQFSESKSQLPTRNIRFQLGCLSSQRYNFLKANHNLQVHQWQDLLVVYQVKDTIFWKQITTLTGIINCLNKLFIKSKIQFSESKSQLFSTGIPKSPSCLSSQRYNFLKANHNPMSYFEFLKIVVYQVKDTIFWKQITT